ncbi:MAG: homoaconitate hydratase [Eubacteriales bacterium]
MIKVNIVDTTLRDGEQTPGVAYSKQDKIHITKCLDELGVDIIEVGIPAMGVEEIDAISEINQLDLRADLLTWNRMKIEDIDKSIETGCKNIHITVPASDVHIQKKLKMTKSAVLEQMKKVLHYGKSKGLEISVGAEDASRARIGFLYQLYKTAEQEGVSRLRYADTVGALDPFSAYEIIREITLRLECPLEFHGHNDLGLATANALGAVKGGAKYISCSINGLGERAGNTSLEEIAVLLEIYGLYRTDIKFNQLRSISKIVERYSGRAVHKGKAIVGDDVFSHESGIHVDGLLKDTSTYELFPPNWIGRERKIVLGKHSGRKGKEYVKICRRFY